jgi:hypothetical protein
MLDEPAGDGALQGAALHVQLAVLRQSATLGKGLRETDAARAAGPGVSWNYRVMRFLDPLTKEPCLAIHEVYYHEDGTRRAYTVDAVGVVGDTPEELGEVLDRMRRALGEPILEPGDFHGSGPC